MCRGYGGSCLLVVGGDFSVSSTISHRELVKSSACRLPALISWIVKMCFSAAVIIILGTQAQTNPFNCTLREREWERLLWLHICLYFNNSTIWRESERKGGCRALKEREGGKQHKQISLSSNVCLLNKTWAFNHSCPCETDKEAKKGYLLVKCVLANIIWCVKHSASLRHYVLTIRQ